MFRVTIINKYNLLDIQFFDPLTSKVMVPARVLFNIRPVVPVLNYLVHGASHSDIAVTTFPDFVFLAIHLSTQ